MYYTNHNNKTTHWHLPTVNHSAPRSGPAVPSPSYKKRTQQEVVHFKVHKEQTPIADYLPSNEERLACGLSDSSETVQPSRQKIQSSSLERLHTSIEHQVADLRIEMPEQLETPDKPTELSGTQDKVEQTHEEQNNAQLVSSDTTGVQKSAFDWASKYKTQLTSPSIHMSKPAVQSGPRYSIQEMLRLKGLPECAVAPANLPEEVRPTADVAPAEEVQKQVDQQQQSLAELEQMLANLSVSKESSEEQSGDPDVFTLQQYQEEVATGRLKPYQGKMHSTIEERYADGYAFNSVTKRWIKTDRAGTAKLAKQNEELSSQLEKMQQKLVLTEQIQATKQELQKLADCCGKERGNTLVIVDTNCWMEPADRVTVERWFERRRAKCTVVVPKEVHRELDRLKGAPNNDRAYNAREAVRLIGRLDGAPSTDNQLEMRGQADEEIFLDEHFHASPRKMRGDDAILNCCMYYHAQQADVTLCTNDHVFGQRGIFNGMKTCRPSELCKTI